MFAKSFKPEEDHGDGQHSGITEAAFLVTGRHPAELLQTIDQALDLIALPIKLTIKRSGAMFVLLSGNGDPNATLTQVLATLAGTIPFVSRYALWAQAHPATLPVPNRPLFQKLLGHT